MSAVNAISSSGLVGFLRCVDRCCPRTRHVSRSETPCLATTSSTHARRRAGLRSFPKLLPSGSTSQWSGLTPLDGDDCFRPQAPSGALYGAGKFTYSTNQTSSTVVTTSGSNVSSASFADVNFDSLAYNTDALASITATMRMDRCILVY